MDDPLPSPAAQPRPPSALTALWQRRRQALPEAARQQLSARPWGLALSGGGIRSATFCFGVLRELARQGLFHRFDFLSTVSGGGYIGATVGKLFHDRPADKPDPLGVEAALADAPARGFATWLRANGRYLIPGGAKDVSFAAASFGRNLVGVHVELALLSLLIGSLLVGLDLAAWGWADCVFRAAEGCALPGGVDRSDFGAFSHWPTAWAALPLVAWMAAVCAFAYWASPASAGQAATRQGLLRRLSPQTLVLTLLLLAALAGLWAWSGRPDPADDAGDANAVLPPVHGLMVVVLAWLCGIALSVIVLVRSGDDGDRARHALTSGLASLIGVAGIVLGLGLLDATAWLLAHQTVGTQSAIGVVLALAAAALRAVLPKVADLPKSLSPRVQSIVMGLLHAAGLLLLALVAAFWCSLVHRVVAGALFPANGAPRALDWVAAWTWLGWLAGPPLVLVLISLRNREFLNRSSLYSFYRARLLRGYLGAANPARMPGRASPLAASSGQASDVDVADVHADDDVAMHQYAPHAAGGPVHLINVCVNQTHDPHGAIFNQDRKGLLMTIAPGPQAAVAHRGWSPVPAERALTLGSWLAISGAAVAPGLGATTRSGLAALLTMAGLRLGYWWDSGSAGVRRRAGKYGQFLAELVGRFDGDRRRDWFLSDGGHFENTGAYALLREQCELIVVADCGADPRYSFGDLENLVRKARIDLQAEITFLRPRLVAEGQESAPPGFGSLNELASPDSQACMALARIEYGRTGQVGHLILIKPTMCQDTPADLTNFKADNPLFPQEPTTDQFFSEAQWESYFQLGTALTRKLPASLLPSLAATAERLFVNDDGAVRTLDASGQTKLVATSRRLSSRIAATGAVSASLSLGAAGSIGVAAWQAIQDRLSAGANAARIEPAVYKELTDRFGRLRPEKTAGPTPVDTSVAEMATTLLRVADAVCTPNNLQAFRQSPLMQMMVDRTRKACEGDAHPSCQRLIHDSASACLQAMPRASCEHRYWVRDYALADVGSVNCPAAAAPVTAATVAPLAPLLPSNAASSAAATSAPVAVGAAAPAAGAAPRPGATTAAPPPAPPPVIATAPPAPPPPPPTVVAEAPCKGITVFVQIYGPTLRDRADELRNAWQRLGASAPGIDDVWDSARRAGRPPPRPFPAPTVIQHQPLPPQCLQKFVPAGERWAWQFRTLAARYTPQPGVVEVWLPAESQMAPGSLPRLASCYQEHDPSASQAGYGVHCHASQVECEKVRGPNARRRQSACQVTDLGALPAWPAFQRGFGDSWFLMADEPFGKPYPPLP